MRVRSLLLTVLLPLAIYGCAGDQGAGAGPGVNDIDVDVAAKGKVVAKVGKGGVTEEDYIERAIRSPSASSGSLSPEAQKEVLDQLIIDEALWQQALAHQLYRDPKVRKIMVNLLLREEIYSKVSASDFSPEQLESYFQAHSDEFVVPEKVQVKRVFLRVGPGRDLKAAMDLASSLRAQLVAQPDRFKEIAVEHSDGPYKRRGGDLGYLSSEGKPGIDKGVVEEAFKLQVGEISQPFEAGGGVNLVTVASKRERVERTFEQMKGSVMRKLKNERYKELTDAYVEGVKGKFDVVVDEAALAAIDLEAARSARMGTAAPDAAPGEEDAVEEDDLPELDH